MSRPTHISSTDNFRMVLFPRKIPFDLEKIDSGSCTCQEVRCRQQICWIRTWKDRIYFAFL